MKCFERLVMAHINTIIPEALDPLQCAYTAPPEAYTTLHTTAGLLLKLSRVGPGQFLDGSPDAAGSGVGGPVGGTL